MRVRSADYTAKVTWKCVYYTWNNKERNTKYLYFSYRLFRIIILQQSLLSINISKTVNVICQRLKMTKDYKTTITHVLYSFHIHQGSCWVKDVSWWCSASSGSSCRRWCIVGTGIWPVIATFLDQLPHYRAYWPRIWTPVCLLVTNV